MVKVKDRNSNFELMRIISMFAIILSHILGHGKMVVNSTNDTITIFLQFLQYFVLFHVNSFVLVSGYFQSKSSFKLSKFLELIFQVIFYSLLIVMVFTKLGIITDADLPLFIKNMLFSSVNNYWFIKVYIVVYLLSDILNKFINSLDRKSYKNTLIVLFIIFSIGAYLSGGKFIENNGYTIYNFVFLYLVGGYIRRYPIKETYHFKNMSVNGYRLLLIFVFFMMIFLNYSSEQLASRIGGESLISEVYFRIMANRLGYSTPFVIIQSVCYFLFFETLNIKSKFINYISSCTFGIYLFHDNSYVRHTIYKVLLIDVGPYSEYFMLARMVIVLIWIFIVGVIIESIRKLFIMLIRKTKAYKNTTNKIQNYLNSFNYKIKW